MWRWTTSSNARLSPTPWRSTSRGRSPTCATVSNPCTGEFCSPCTKWGCITTNPTASAPESSATRSVNIILTATAPYTTLWCVSRRISPSISRSWTDTATSAAWTAIPPRPCVTRKRGFQSWRPKCSKTSTRKRWTLSPTSTATNRNPPSCPPASPTFW